MYIAVVGCAHGQLDAIYETVLESEKYSNKKIDLLICCGDFQAVRNIADLSCMARPERHKEVGSFWKYYSGEKVAPILTIFIGGNHEASNHLGELFYGGWAAPNIYYLGCAGVVNIGGLRIAGLSGIYKRYDYCKGHFEKPPFTSETVRSIYNIRNLEVYRLKQLTGKIDIFLSHDWPLGINQYGDSDELIKKKPRFKEQVDRNDLGNPPAMQLLKLHQPSYWFAAHMHCKFPALVPEQDGPRLTKFISLDECGPEKDFLQILEIKHDENASMDLHYDLKWLSILYLTNHLLNVRSCSKTMPDQNSNNDLPPLEKDTNLILKKFENDLKIPQNFYQSVKSFDSNDESRVSANVIINDQTTKFCNILGIDDPFTLLNSMQLNRISEPFNTATVECAIKKFSINEEESCKSSLSPSKIPDVNNENIQIDKEIKK